MQSMGCKAIAIAIAGLSVFNVVAGIDPIVIKGAKFFYETNGTEFFIKGVAYQQTLSYSTDDNQLYIDPLSVASSCERDIPYISGLGMNAIRVYTIDPTQNHDECMSAFADAGIYVMTDLSAPTTGSFIDQDDPSWDVELYSRYTSVIDVMQKYDNTLGFFVGNDIAELPGYTDVAPFIRASVRDMKKYISDKSYRDIGVGYAMNVDRIAYEMVDYLNCGDPDSGIDFFGYNVYEWCGSSTYTESGYSALTNHFLSFSVPSFFAQYGGCNTVEPRTFEDVLALYGPQMSLVFSGGIAYEYFQDESDYAMIYCKQQ